MIGHDQTGGGWNIHNKSSAYDVVRQFEAALCEYTGARFAVTVNSCTMALLLAVAWCIRWMPGNRPPIEVPRRTYCSVPMAIMHAGGRPTFRDEEWLGAYQLSPLPVWDCARLFTSGMHSRDQFQCVSFHASKTLGDTQGGAILHDDPLADAWLRRARFDGRREGLAPKDDADLILGWHCYMSNDVAARLLHKLSVLPAHNDPLPNDDYPDLSTMEIFR